MNPLSLSNYDYAFDASLTATSALKDRSKARLMVAHRERQSLAHDVFLNLAEYLPKGALVVVNDTSVIPARFLGRRQSGGQLEGLFLSVAENGVWVWLKGKVYEGEEIEIHGFGFTKVERKDDKRVLLMVPPEAFVAFLRRAGLVPLPPYIRAERERLGSSETKAEDQADYQSVFAKPKENRVSVAAPTASLHFDHQLLENLKSRGIELKSVRLDVGEGTFEPLSSDDLSQVELHEERVSIEPEVWKEILEAKVSGRKIVAVGTTVLRALESAARRGEGESLDFSTNLFVKPPFEFKMVDALITNFHWPKSSLLVLVATLMGDFWKTAYAEALRERYRLFSYGDGMLIL